MQNRKNQKIHAITHAVHSIQELCFRTLETREQRSQFDLLESNK